jgi:hypothetical protein
MPQPPRGRDPSDEPFPGYDALTAREIAERLHTLSPAQREAVEAYERRGRARRTVLTRAAELRGRRLVDPRVVKE